MSTSRIALSRYLSFILLLSSLNGFSGTNKNLAAHVNPMVGTDEHGHTFPAAALPGGLVQLGPDTDIHGWDWSSGYHYGDHSIMGFSHLHRSGMGAGDWGDILVMPLTGPLKFVPGAKDHPGDGYRSTFSHDDEVASPGYYAVTLKDYQIRAELTVTQRAGFHQYTFPQSEQSHILIDMNHGIGDNCTRGYIQVISPTEIRGFRESKGFVRKQQVYFYARFSKPFKTSGTWSKGVITGLNEVFGNEIGAFVDYSTAEKECIRVKVGISYTSIEEAKQNLDLEMPNWNFNQIRAKAVQKWNKALSRIEIEPAKANEPAVRAKQLNTFYTALYHALLFPATFGDVDGNYRGLDDQRHKAEGFTYLSDFSLWDTFRAEMPLLTLVAPERSQNAVQTWIAQYEQGGWLPTPQQFGNSYTNDMIGDHPVVAILDAYRKGIRNFDLQKAYEAVRKNAMETPPSNHPSGGRRGLEYYLKLGYLPYDLTRESVSKTLEYAFNDWCVAQLAKEAGRNEDYQYFMQRASNYKKVMDLTTGFARPKDSQGKWLEPFDPKFVGHGKDRHYTEANAYQYTFFVPHDIAGVMNLMGGPSVFESRLDSLFTTSSEIKGGVPDITGLIGQYAHGNEPGHHSVYLYNYVGRPWKTQALARKVMDELYHDGPAGLCGNEDMGQMSAWYVLSAMGFYPVAPGQNVYSLGSPLFQKMILHLAKGINSGSRFVVETRNNSLANKYIQAATLNGKPLAGPWFTQEELQRGGQLVLMMGPEPNQTLWNTEASAPPSMSH